MSSPIRVRRTNRSRGNQRRRLYTFVTALEREDIEALSNALYKIPKTVDKFTTRILVAPQHVPGH